MWYEAKPDLVHKAPHWFEMKRGYWSRRAEYDRAHGTQSIVGPGWGTVIDQTLEILDFGADGQLVSAFRWNGRIDRFWNTSAGGAYLTEPGNRRKYLGKSGGDFYLADEDGTQYWFKTSGGVGKLFRIREPRDPQGRRDVNICYGTATSCSCSGTPAAGALPCQIVPSAGPAVFVNVDQQSGLLSSLTWVAFAGQTGAETIATYGYSNGRLTSFTRGVTAPVETTQYAYDEIYLASVVGPGSIPVESHVWGDGSNGSCDQGDFCRVVQTTTPETTYEITYLSGATRVLDVNDPTVDYTVAFNGNNQVTSITGGGCQSNIVGYAYGTDFEPQAVLHADGTYTSYQRDYRGRPIKEVAGDNDSNPSNQPPAGARVTEFIYSTTSYRNDLLAVVRDGALEIDGAIRDTPAKKKTFAVLDFNDTPALSTCTDSDYCAPTDFGSTSVGQPARSVRVGYTRDENGLVVPKAIATTFGYTDGRLSLVDDPEGGRTLLLYYSQGAEELFGRPSEMRRQLGSSTTGRKITQFIDYDRFGNPKKIRQGALYSYFSYDDQGRLVQYRPPDKTTSPLVYNLAYGDHGKLTTLTLPSGKAYKLEYDSAGRLVRIGFYASVSAANPSESLVYTRDGRGNTEQESHYSDANPLDASPGIEVFRRKYRYDNRQRVTATESFTSGSSSDFRVFQYDAVSRLQAITDENHAQSATDTANANLEYDYSRTGVLSSLLRKVGGAFGQEWEFGSDAHDNTASVTDGAGRTSGFEHDDFGRVLQVSGALDVETLFDGLDRPVRRQESLFFGEVDGQGLPLATSVATTVTYDHLGHTTNIDAPRHGVEIAYSGANESVTTCFGGAIIDLLNRNDRMASANRRFQDKINKIWRTTEEKYGYDRSGRVNVIARKEPNASCYHVFEYEYDSDGRIESITYPSRRKVAYSYDADGRLLAVDHVFEAVTTPIASAVTTRNDRLYRWTDGASRMHTISRDLSGRFNYHLVGSLKNPEFVWAVTSRDGLGNPTALSAVAGATPLQTQSFQYNDRLSLVAASNSGQLAVSPYTTLAYGYTAAGDRSSVEVDGQGPTNYCYTGFRLTKTSSLSCNSSDPNAKYYHYAGADKRISAVYKLVNNEPAFDFVAESTADGLVESIRYDAAGSRSFRHDAFGKRTAVVWASGSTSLEFWSHDGRMLAEMSEPYSAQKSIREYVYAGGEIIAVLTSRRTATYPPLLSDLETYYLTTNHVGAVIRGTDENGNVVLTVDYDPFGRATVSGTLPFALRLPGQYQDGASALYYNWYRYYDSRLGRYLQPEPLMQLPEAVGAYAQAGVRLNPYAYALNSPLHYVDSNGLNPAVVVLAPPVIIGGEALVAAGVITAGAYCIGTRCLGDIARYFKKKDKSSPNQMDKECKKGKAPKEVDRVDKAHPPEDPQDHTHLKDGTRIRKDGTVDPPDANVSRAVRDWLRDHGWPF
jgi:RHS repeat-associated protein